MSYEIYSKIGFFLDFKKVLVTKTKRIRGCSDPTEKCKQSRQEEWEEVSPYLLEDEQRFCEFCGSPIKFKFVEYEINASNSLETMNYVYRNLSADDHGRMQNILYTPEDAPDGLAVIKLRWDKGVKKPSFMDINFADDRKSFPLNEIIRPELPSIMKEEIEWAITKINSVLGVDSVNLEFGFFSYSY